MPEYMKRITAIFALLLGVMTAAFAASQPAWYNDVTSISNNGQYYIYSANGSGFMEAGNSSVVVATKTATPSLFTITTGNEGQTYSGTKYVVSYQTHSCGPIGKSNTEGNTLVWTLMDNTYWNIHGKYKFLGTKYAALKYESGGYDAAANVLGQLETQTGAEYQWYLVSQNQYTLHWLIYDFEVLKESINLSSYSSTVHQDIYSALATAMTPTFNVQSSTTAAVQTAYGNLVAAKAAADAYPAQYQTALQAFTDKRTSAQNYTQGTIPTAVYDLLHAYDNLTPDVVTTSIADLNTATTNLDNAIQSADATGTPYLAALDQVTAVRSSDLGDGDLTPVITELNTIVTQLNAALTVSDIATAISALKQVDAITFVNTNFTVGETLANMATAASAQNIAYTSQDLSTVNASMKALKSGTCDIEAYTPGNATYYPFRRIGTVTIGKTLPTVTVTASDITYPATTHTSRLTLTSGSTPGTLSWNEPDVSLAPGTYTGLSVHFTPTNTSVYAEIDVTTTLRVLAPTTYGTATGGCCPGYTYYYPANGQTYSVGTHTVTLTRRNHLGGDSIVTLTVTNYTSYPDKHQYVTICHGQTFLWNCDQLTTSGDYHFTGMTSHGCDSIVTLHLTVLPASTNTFTKTIAIGTPEYWRNFDLSTYSVGDHELRDTLTSSVGCDSVLILNLTVIPKGPDTYGFDSAYVCPGDTAVYLGQKMVRPGAYSFVIPNTVYGDSIITFYVRNYPVYSKRSNRILHQGTNYKWRGRQLSGYDEGSYVIWDSLKSVYGCDSLFYLTLTILPPETQYGDVYYSICPGDTLLYNNTQYTDSGLYSILVPEKSIYRGDSIVRLHLAFYSTFLHNSRSIIYEGQHYTWRGRNLGTYPVGDTWISDTLQTSHGCDSIYRLYLTVNEVPTTYRYDTAYLCDGASMRYFHDTIISTSGDYTFRTTNYLGGDSIIRLHVETHSSFRAERYDTITQGDVIRWRGRELYLRPFDHYLADTFTTVYGCDSIYSLYVHVYPRQYTIIEEMDACQNSYRTWRGMPVPTDSVGFFPEVLTKHFYSGFDADSVYVLNLTVNPSPVTHFYLTWRQGHQKTWYQEHFSTLAPGFYTFTSGRFLHTFYGCDSLEVMHLQVLPTTYGLLDVNLCPGETFNYYGKTYSAEGTYTVVIDNHYCGKDTLGFGPQALQAHGDSIITLNIHRRPTYDLHPEMRAQYGDVFWWRGQRYVLEVGTFIFRDTTKSQYGCDSMTTMTVIVDRAQQTIAWNPDVLSVHVADSILLSAAASSGLPVSFTSSSLFYAYVNEGSWLIGRVEGKATITALQNGDANYYAAPPVQYVFDILEPLPYKDLPSVPDDPSSLSAPVKLLRDGRLYILTPDGLFDALGNKIE